MEGDAGSGRLNPIPPADDAERDEVAVVDEALPHRSSLSARWLAGVCAALVIAALALGAGGYLALRSHQKSVATVRAEAAALAAAKDCVTATQAPDASAMEASQRKIIECATGGFGAQATLYSGLLVDAYQAANVQVQVSDMRAAVERHNDDGSMDVLVAMRVKVSNTEAQGQEQGYRLRVKMMPDAGTYKIADLAQVSK
ncbi:hypothetical protein [Candidatus Mycolicibacterium alkanivorans]|uniref:Mce protein n=1 Tax=Candidatus Mycolicibacterium alkanivorans TaxID=2954114 RepID=A0ABS9YSL8_9MYCO|nr:hypothetical protein [Candidatus Mycolicibacterium alkanivorans]MCI4673867.1 hypothetical protein [Candidatus Mycolicibacterium alkanivorans]